MRLLLDSHAVIWAVDDPSRLSAQAVVELQTPANELVMSAATIWEIAIKLGMRKLSLSMPYEDWMSMVISQLRLSVLPITVEYAGAQAALPFHHRDPFDRLLVAQSIVEQVTLVSNDPVFDQYGVTRLW
ncbi:MAG: type II toxin-antitoxin system VapC family toxin [Pirellulaceae bacterium]|nr:type II toxin-antitoxin system VapC family toxin [Pirellulaceae bacterium]